ncbi:MAG: flagellar basal body protein FliL [Alphaproteobacteria bacterium]|nr:flagellar basal body-associated FliL family protein [Alphaproteobacteria bacterium]TAD88070.1 MAG: flagellar basal body protein FliL [Alphaproteobacteria bacterium]
MAADMTEDMGGRMTTTRKRLSGKKLALFVVLPLVLIAAAGAGVYFTGLLDRVMAPRSVAEADPAPRAERPRQPAYFDLQDILVNLRSDTPRPVFLKISISLELDRIEDRAAVERVLPRVIDTFQVYLRELRPDQLQGSAGLVRLREELLNRINVAVRPAQVRDVLFREMLIQ